jgi:hypothetical protein
MIVLTTIRAVILLLLCYIAAFQPQFAQDFCARPLSSFTVGESIWALCLMIVFLPRQRTAKVRDITNNCGPR